LIDLMSLLSTGLAFFIVAVTPGPATISNATVAMSHGRKTSLIYGAGLSTGLVFWGLVAATGMGAVLQSSVYILITLKIIGGLYLLWLALQSFRTARLTEVEHTVTSGETRWFLRGLLLNLSNPKSVLAWMAALSLSLDTKANYMSIGAATLLCILVGYLTNGSYSILFSIGGMMRAYQRNRSNIHYCVAVLFALAGFGLIRSAYWF